MLCKLHRAVRMLDGMWQQPILEGHIVHCDESLAGVWSPCPRFLAGTPLFYAGLWGCWIITVWTIPVVLPFLEASSFLLPSHESFWNSHSRLGFVLTQLLSRWPQWFRFVLVSESGYSPSADSLLLLLCWALKCVPVCLVNVCVQLWVPEASSF